MRKSRRTAITHPLGSDPEEVELTDLEYDISNGLGCCLVYEENREIGGFVYAQHLRENGRKSVRVYLSVEPRFEGRWHGVELYRDCETALRGKGYSEIIFATTSDNKVINWMGKKFGFEFLETRGSLNFYKKIL